MVAKRGMGAADPRRHKAPAGRGFAGQSEPLLGQSGVMFTVWRFNSPLTLNVTLQDGQVVAIDRLRRYEPFCELEVNDVLDSEQQVRPGRFAATQIIRQQELGAKHPPALLAASTVTASESDTANATWTLASWDNPLRLNQVHFQLQSGAQPNVRELRCAGGWAFTSNVAYPTLAEMNRALGALVSIEIN